MQSLQHKEIRRIRNAKKLYLIVSLRCSIICLIMDSES